MVLSPPPPPYLFSIVISFPKMYNTWGLSLETEKVPPIV
jgi:hypothetical protein